MDTAKGKHKKDQNRGVLSFELNDHGFQPADNVLLTLPSRVSGSQVRVSREQAGTNKPPCQ